MMHAILSARSFSSGSAVSPTAGAGLRRRSVFLLAMLPAAALFLFGGLHAGAVRPTPAAFDDFTGKRLPVARLTLDAKGFAPATISRPKGPFLLAIHNRTKIDDLDLTLSRVAGNKLRDVNFRKQKSDWRNFITLPPGEYVLSVAGRPAWTCNIQIRAN
jgi:hypothetical protein